MRTAVLALAASCALLAACIQEVPEDLNPGDGAGAAGPGPGTVSSGPTTGSGGGSSTGPSSGSPAEAFFNENVRPLMTAKCSHCHMTGGVSFDWLGTGEDTYYVSIKTFPGLVVEPEQSRLLVKGPHYTSGPDTFFEEAEAATVRQWLELELSDPTGDPVYDGPTPEELLQKFVDEMTVDQWIQAEMPDVARQPLATKSSCAAAGCHNLGVGNNWMLLPEDPNYLMAFDMMKDTLNILSLVRPEVIPTGDGRQKAIIVQSCRYIDKGLVIGGPEAHPGYTLSQENVDRVTHWFQLVTASLNGGEASTHTCQ